jgi:DNA-binding MarR family transcriptional regulator
LLHRIEALARLHFPSPLDPVSFFVLKALAISDRARLQDLDQRLHLGLPLLHQLLGRLEGENLVRREEAGTWSLTEAGRQAVQQNRYLQVRQERRVFYFVEHEQPARPPHYLNFAHPPATLPWPAGDGWRFELSHLQACVGRPVDWKQRFGFPMEVQQILGTNASESSSPASQEWQRIILDRPERLPVALVLTQASKGKERFLGFIVQSEGWALQAAEPAIVLEAEWQEVFPQLTVDPPLHHWQDAWRAWCQPRGLPAAEVAACVLERQGHRLRVLATPRLIERLRAARSDVFKGEAWLLAGTGPLRTAAQVELVEMKREGIPPIPSGKT